MTVDEEACRADLARLRDLITLRLERERLYDAALIERDAARRAWTALVASPGPLDADLCHSLRGTLHRAELAVDAAGRALAQIKNDISRARLDYEVDLRRWRSLLPPSPPEQRIPTKPALEQHETCRRAAWSAISLSSRRSCPGLTPPPANQRQVRSTGRHTWPLAFEANATLPRRRCRGTPTG